MGDFGACHSRLWESGGLLRRYIGHLPPALSCTFFFHQRRRVVDVQANPVDWCGYGYWLPMDIPWRARTQISLQHAILRAAIYRDVWRDIKCTLKKCLQSKFSRPPELGFPTSFVHSKWWPPIFLRAQVKGFFPGYISGRKPLVLNGKG